MTIMNDKISVLMGVYNCSSTLEEAVNSIIGQTYENWELIICDDGSSDNTYEVAERMQKKDGRIVLIRNEENCGLNVTLNKCLKKAAGTYIARMDGDDISLPERFEKELTFLKEHPEYDIVSTQMIFFDENGEWGRTHTKEKPEPENVVCGSPICHAPVMMTKACIDDAGGYTEDKRMLRVEDVNLWIKLYTKGYRCYNLQEPLYKMRNDQNALKRRKYIYRINSTYVRLKGCRTLNLGVKCYVKSFRPMINGIVPAKLRDYVKRKRMK